MKYVTDTAALLGLSNVVGVAARAEEYAKAPVRESFDCVTARAVANLRALSELCLPFVKVGGLFLSMKATGAREELEDARRAIGSLGGKVEKIEDFTLTDGMDTVRSYFALRTIGIDCINGKNYITLNGKPYFFHGLLDQGYFSDGIYLPATEKGFEYDIVTMKECGFNMLRKHIKIEPEIFYYYCDKYGMIVTHYITQHPNDQQEAIEIVNCLQRILNKKELLRKKHLLF